ncbi:MAG: hydantoinase B/oxoprolinase family protein [Alphaproteobacteria bacterium]|nr:MAG: hydantoinase B/oxoprolinase family protein [Alphaproteobacteria bacterium]
MDAITIQILRNKVASLVDEMHYHFYRSGYSTIIRESRDFSCVILDREGRLIVAPPMFFHAPVYRHLVGRILKLYGGTDAIKDGDVFVSNHPYEGGLPHVSDMAFVAPVFAAGGIVAFAGSIAHKADVGGAVAGSTSADATEMFHEGLLVPPIKIVDAGVAQTDVERIILTNSRQPALVRGDIHAQIAVTQMGAQRVKQLCERFGAGTVGDAFAAILKGAADELRAAIAKRTGSRASTSPTALRRPEVRSICGPPWSRLACSTRSSAAWARTCISTTACARWCGSHTRRARSPMPSRRPPSPTTRWSTSSWWMSFSRRSPIFIPRAPSPTPAHRAR